ncbi:MAG: phosphate signaling complex protein PhoU [Alphaproteobacteria bacterium]|nr:phosphate signaling complex protein PhoU [Alphaproteobacteria bacterium]MDE2340394.1 phosphate signaling complex protein PhoU [Alphaproteobacteria bacterium]
MNLAGEHTLSAFDEDMTRLRALLSEMGGRAEKAIDDAMAALVAHDLDASARIIAEDIEIDRLEIEVERLAVQIITLRAPVADDLREVIAALKVASVVERIGDYAKNIAKRVAAIEVSGRAQVLTVLNAMAEVASEMLHDVLNAFAARDATAAVEINQRDSAVDEFYNAIFRMLVSFMMENPQSISSGAHLLFVAKNLERMGDHATNIAEMIYYVATGSFMPERERGELPVV